MPGREARAEAPPRRVKAGPFGPLALALTRWGRLCRGAVKKSSCFGLAGPRAAPDAGAAGAEFGSRGHTLAVRANRAGSAGKPDNCAGWGPCGPGTRYSAYTRERSRRHRPPRPDRRDQGTRPPARDHHRGPAAVSRSPAGAPIPREAHRPGDAAATHRRSPARAGRSPARNNPRRADV